MENVAQFIERNGTVDSAGQLHLDTPLPLPDQSRVRIVILANSGAEYDDSEISEKEWRRFRASNPAFAWLADPAEDIYIGRRNPALP